ncbi:ubiquitin-conjugating enzyme E2Q-like protein 1 [Lethenteron reissneri]|uniref:ubiquitin-conjugating enzyme E2Q-like protein 1 n=1 Tax=Lethenteron reissneri TaxID=7753 RepID=UPI002AB7A917|nr:ubiquitin-conjugating enzyme E2Q-like protein 1 [Lethenteron reissneri]
MATLLRKIGLIRFHQPETGSPKGSRKARKNSITGGGGGNNNNNSSGGGSSGGGGGNNNNSSGGGGGGSQKGKACVALNGGGRDGGTVSLPQAGGRSTEPAKAEAVPPPPPPPPPPHKGLFGKPSSSSSSSLPPAPANRQHSSQVRARRLMKELQDLNRLSEEVLSVELVDDNLFEWNVKLYQIDRDSALWQDMRETGVDGVLLNLAFPENFPFSPPFMRVLSPRIENGYVLDGGAICMELLTPRGWSSAYTVEAVVRQFAASLIKGQGRICRKASKAKKAFTRKEAEATFKSLVKTHEKYGWVTPPSSEG